MALMYWLERAASAAGRHDRSQLCKGLGNYATTLAYWQGLVSDAELRRLNTERDEATKRAIALAPDLPAALDAKGWREADKRNWLAATRLIRTS